MNASQLSCLHSPKFCGLDAWRGLQEGGKLKNAASQAHEVSLFRQADVRYSGEKCFFLRPSPLTDIPQATKTMLCLAGSRDVTWSWAPGVHGRGPRRWPAGTGGMAGSRQSLGLHVSGEMLLTHLLRWPAVSEKQYGAGCGKGAAWEYGTTQ